ncbi:MAG: MBL fold metallo-hydrolase, partial [Spirochaetaceae bacterium]|nr:MBL fold metallo-hydrolase [Spirochaetaceae bacterium]
LFFSFFTIHIGNQSRMGDLPYRILSFVNTPDKAAAFGHTGIIMHVTVLGSGTSHGIPVIGCDCPVCKSADPRDTRTRASLYVRGESGERVVIDTGPEFRLQALRAGIGDLDAVFLTHTHADHVHGLDDIRALTWDKAIPVYANELSIAELKERFSYIFRKTQMGGGKPRIIPIVLESTLNIGNLGFTPVPLKHGALDIFGWRITEAGRGRNAAPEAARTVVYMTDTSAVPETSWPLIRGADTHIIGAIRTKPHATHFSFGQALETAAQAGTRRMFITHISHNSSHREIEEICREFREKRNLGEVTLGPAWDGLEISAPFRENGVFPGTAGRAR